MLSLQSPYSPERLVTYKGGVTFLNSNGAGATGGWGSLNGSAGTSDINCWFTSTAPSAWFCMVGSQGLYCGTSSSSRGSRTICVWSACLSVCLSDRRLYLTQNRRHLNPSPFLLWNPSAVHRERESSWMPIKAALDCLYPAPCAACWCYRHPCTRESQ